MTTAVATRPATKSPMPGKKPVRIMFITARYFFKTGTMAGSVCYGVRSIKTVKGEQVTNNYQCFIHTDGVVSCNCESRKALCSHALFVSEIENERDTHEAEQEQEVAEVLAQLDEQAKTSCPKCDDCPGALHPLCCTNTLATPEPADMLASVNAELAKVEAPAATAEELAATRDKLLLPDDADQAAYFIQLSRRSDALRPVPTPTVRNVSQDWLLNGSSHNGTFSGRVA